MKLNAKIGRAGAAAALLLLVAGCSSGATAANSQASAPIDPALAKFYEPPTGLTVTAPLPVTPPKGIKVVYLNGGQPPDQQHIAGMEAACKVLTWECTTMPIDHAVPTSLASSAEQAIHAGANAIIINVTEAALFKSVLPLAAEKNVVVIDMLSPNEPLDGVTQVIPSSVAYGAQGKALGQALMADAKANNHKPNVLEVTLPAFEAILGPVGNGYRAATKDCDGCSLSVLNVSYEDYLNGNSAKAIVSYLQGHPDVNYILFDSGDISSGVRNAIKAAGLTPPTFFGTIPSAAQFSELRQGTSDQYSSSSIEVEGWIGIDAIARELTGDKSKPWATAEEPLQLFTKSNIGELKESPQLPEGYEAMFEKMWKVK